MISDRQHLQAMQLDQTPEKLDELANVECWITRAYVSIHINTSAKTLEKLIDDEDCQSFVLNNPNTPEYLKNYHRLASYFYSDYIQNTFGEFIDD